MARARRSIIQMIITLASGTLLPLALVSGLLVFPTSCRCGATLPHEHSLFVVHDHHHGDAAVPEPAHARVEMARVAGVTLTAPAFSTVGSPMATLPAASDMIGAPDPAHAAGRTSSPPATSLAWSPEPPPPRG